MRIKEKSLRAFLESHGSDFKGKNPRHFLGNVFYIRTGRGILPGEKIQIETTDHLAGTGHRVALTHYYEVGAYDDISLKVKKTEIRISFKNEE